MHKFNTLKYGGVTLRHACGGRNHLLTEVAA